MQKSEQLYFYLRLNLGRGLETKEKNLFWKLFSLQYVSEQSTPVLYAKIKTKLDLGIGA